MIGCAGSILGVLLSLSGTADIDAAPDDGKAVLPVAAPAEGVETPSTAQPIHATGAATTPAPARPHAAVEPASGRGTATARPAARANVAAPAASERATPPTQPVRGKVVAEFGFLDPLAHSIQFGRSGTEFDYVEDGGQDVLFPTMRFSLEGTFGGRHTLILLYQPIDLRTEETLKSDLVVDDQRFPAGTPMTFRYGFDYYRASYLYNLLSCPSACELSIGASLQFRNAIVDFTSADGELSRSNRDVGPVPALKSRGRLYLGERSWLGYEVDGMYAPVKYVNGGSSDVVGAILDLSLRAGYEISAPLGVFFNLRYLGGGAEGTSKSDAERGPGDGYSSNWLHFMSSTLGFEIKLEELSGHP